MIRIKKFVFLGSIYLLLSFLLIGVLPARAQTDPVDPDASCVSCHQDLYLNYDTGKYYCLCGTRVHCTNCHLGVSGAEDEKTAHEGMVANPGTEQYQTCKECHPQDYAEKIEKFAAVAGVHATPPTIPPLEPPDTQMIAQTGTDWIDFSPIEAWRYGGLGLVGISLLVVGFFAFRCYKEDCLRSRNNG